MDGASEWEKNTECMMKKATEDGHHLGGLHWARFMDETKEKRQRKGGRRRCALLLQREKGESSRPNT